MGKNDLITNWFEFKRNNHITLDSVSVLFHWIDNSDENYYIRNIDQQVWIEGPIDSYWIEIKVNWN